jgi:uncharacterized protein (TIGR03083 family)
VYDREIGRLKRYLHQLDARGWSRASHCAGWSVKDVVAHLSTDEVYNQACVDRTVDELPFSGGLNGWNDRGVRIRRGFSAMETLQEWEARQQRVREAWEQLGLSARIETSVGRYPLMLEVWHLAREYAIHADDIEVPVPKTERQEQLRWRAGFSLWAAANEGEDDIDATLQDGRARLRQDGQEYDIDLETFVAYLTGRPQQLKDPKQRALVRRLT